MLNATPDPGPLSGASLPAPLSDGQRCPDCGYDLRHLTSPRCPECGFDLNTIRSAESHLPWTRRGGDGWLRAYRRTVLLVMWRNRRFQLELGRPVDWRQSQTFRWTTVAIAFVPVTLAALVWRLLLQRRWELDAYTWIGTGGVLLGGLLLLVLAPGLASYTLESRAAPRALRNRAIALSYYAWAPLSLAFIPALVFLVSAWPGLPDWLEGLLRPASFGGLGYLFVASWASVGHLAGHVVPGRRALLGRMLGMAGATVLLAALLLFAFPLSLLFLWEVLRSLLA